MHATAAAAEGVLQPEPTERVERRQHQQRVQRLLNLIAARTAQVERLRARGAYAPAAERAIAALREELASVLCKHTLGAPGGLTAAVIRPDLDAVTAASLPHITTTGALA